MRKLIVGGLTLAALLSMTMATTGAAQTVVGIGAGGGASIPTGDFGDVAKAGWSTGAGLFIYPNGGRIGFRADGGYTRHNEDGGDGVAKFFTGMGSLLISFPTEANIMPYIVAGAGVMSRKFDDEDAVSAVAFQGGAGVTLGRGNVRLFLEGKFVSSTKDDDTISLIPILAGVSYRFR